MHIPSASSWQPDFDELVVLLWVPRNVSKKWDRIPRRNTAADEIKIALSLSLSYSHTEIPVYVDNSSKITGMYGGLSGGIEDGSAATLSSRVET